MCTYFVFGKGVYTYIYRFCVNLFGRLVLLPLCIANFRSVCYMFALITVFYFTFSRSRLARVFLSYCYLSVLTPCGLNGHCCLFAISSATCVCGFYVCGRMLNTPHCVCVWYSLFVKITLWLARRRHGILNDGGDNFWLTYKHIFPWLVELFP